MRAGDMPEFMDRALCAEVDAEIFYPEQVGSVRAAKEVCKACDVRAECLAYALDTHEQWGVWGGLTERQRAKVRRERDDETRAAS